MEKQTNRFIDTVKGFHRVGNFPSFDDEIYSSFAEAQEYAKNGAFGGTAYPGQLLKILSADDNSSLPKVYMIDTNYNLVSTTDHIATDQKLVYEFNSNTLSGSDIIKLPEGFILNKLTINISEPFKMGSAIKIVLVTSKNKKTILADYDETIIDDLEQYDDGIYIEEEFIFNITQSIKEKASIQLFFNDVDQTDSKKGLGIVKLN